MPVFDGFDYTGQQTGLEGFPIIATLRKGVPKDQGLKELPYFRWDMKPGYEPFIETLNRMFGAQPTVLTGMILTGGNTLDKIYPHWMMEFAGNNVLSKRCNGETCVKYLDKATGEYITTGVPCFRDRTGCACEYHAALTFYLPEFTMETGVFGQFYIPVTSKIEIVRTRAYLSSLQRLGVDLTKLLFEYRREPESIAIPKPGQGRIKAKKHINVLQVLPEHMTGVIAAMREKTAALAPGETALQLADSNPTIPPWDKDSLIKETSGSFDNPHHQEQAIAAAQKLGVILPNFSTDEALMKFKTWRRMREAGDKHWSSDVAAVQRLVERAARVFNMTLSDVSAALRIDAGTMPIDWFGIPAFTATPQDAWDAVCLYACDYEAGTVGYEVERGNIAADRADLLLARLDAILKRKP